MHLDSYMMQLHQIYFDVYGGLGATEEDFNALVSTIARRHAERSPELLALDTRPHDWYVDNKMVGMMLYVDLFAGDFKGLIKKIPYLVELGITYVHLMPLLKPRKGENDGGYAVEDYKSIDTRLGSQKDFKKMIETFRASGIDVCIDYVLNHTSNTHEWAKKALQGHKASQDMYIMFPDRTIPDQYEKTVPEVLPNKAPGNFVYVKEIDRWVFSSFSDFQWDLNFKNPKVFEEIVDIMLYLANMGITILRLDAIAYLWKEVGTTCRNLPQVHKILQMLHLVKEKAAPSLALLGEAIVEPDEIFKYFGDSKQMECGILYNANMMVNIYNALATRDVRLLQIDNSRFKVPKTGCFMNYVRCHDDIGWGLSEQALSDLGFDPFLHKQFLIDFYSRDMPHSFAKGEVYQYNAITRDARTNGALASLLGLEKAIEEKDLHARIYAHNRIKLVHAFIFAHRGIPLIYSGDELATLNDHSYLDDPHKAEEGRWIHRASFDWEKAENRFSDTADEGVVYQFIKKLIAIRKSEKLFTGKLDGRILDVNNPSVYAFYKEDNDDQIICLFNFSEHKQAFTHHALRLIGQYGVLVDRVTGKVFDTDLDTLYLYPYEFLWLKKPE